MSSNYQLSLIKQTHQNHYLFSEYYLDKIVPTLDFWKDEIGLKEAFDEIKKIYLRNLPQVELLKDERRNEEYFIVPVLKVLNPHFEFQPKALSVEGKKRPDYAFFPDEKAKKEAGKKLIQEKYKEYFATATAVGDAKYWDRPLDKKDTKGKDGFTNANPNFQIDFYLRASNLKWGVLTNGRLWRLYNRDTSYKLDNFYQVDLTALIQQNDLEKFKYFYHFFKLQAFLPDVQGLTFLDRVYKESISYATEIGDELKHRVYEAFEECGKGFLSYLPNNLSAENLEEIREHSLILLYRLLFILYAESRKLLPVEEGTSYLKNYSLEKIKKEIGEKLDKNEALSAESDIYWNRLKNLFKIINNGDKDLGVPEYNGGLFKPEKNEFLDKYNIGDSYLAKVLDLLARASTKKGKEEELDFVSYRDLEIRHLGSIYEGLLENKLKKANEKLYVIKEKKKELVVSAKEAKGKKVLKEIEPGEIYLATDKSERKATGSYYTPDYIVKYIVENTLGPLIENKSPEEILELNILDPAMGSGHFLVRATEFLAEAIATHPEVKTQVGLDDENELNFWKRQVVERCIYGVDLNLLAVELAKLSLWLATVAKGKPLSFLDHHLRCGNSLIGARLKDLGFLPKKKKKEIPVAQLTFVQEEWFKQDVWHFLKIFKEIEQQESSSKKAIDQKYILLQTLEKAREKYKKIADLWTSVYFGNAMDDAIYRSAVEGLRNEKQRKLSEKTHIEIFEKLENLAKEKRFFHWELEFPEVFFDEYGREKDNPGFDSVIGNPPWGGEIEREAKQFYKKQWLTAQSKCDSYIIFEERSLELVKNKAFFGFIVPYSWLAIQDAEILRRILLLSTKIRNIVYLYKLAFPDVANETTIMIVEKLKNKVMEGLPVENNIAVYFIDPNDTNITDLHNYHWSKKVEVNQVILWRNFRKVIDVLTPRKLLNKVEQSSVKLKEIAEVGLGIQPYASYKHGPEAAQKRIFHSTKKESNLHKAELRGINIQRFYIDWAGDNWVKYGPWLHCPRDPKFYLNEKIVLRQVLGDKIILSIDKEQFFADQSVFLVIKKEGSKYNLLYIASLLASQLTVFYYRLFYSEIKQMFPKLKVRQLSSLPIRQIFFTTSSSQHQKLLEKSKREYVNITNEIKFTDFSHFSDFRNSEIGKIVQQCLIAKPEKSDVVHDFLAFLAEQMIEMCGEKQKEIKTFLKWLSGEIKADFGNLALKTKIKDYYQSDFDSVWQALKKNERKIQVSLSHNFMGKLEKEFDLSMKKLTPLKARIQGTDKLIDQIVYQLYGLTEEEIKIVEA